MHFKVFPEILLVDLQGRHLSWLDIDTYLYGPSSMFGKDCFRKHATSTSRVNSYGVQQSCFA
jgi:hypothetical protein